MSSIFNNQNIERMRVNGNEIALAKINGNVVFQKNKLLKTFFGDSKQNTTSGKNLLNIKDNFESNDITITKNKDGTITIKGTSSPNGNTFGLLNNNFIFNPNETYTFWFNEINNKKIEGSIWLWNQTDQNSNITLSNDLKEKSFSFNKEVEIAACNITIPANIYLDITIQLQIEKGSVATEYEPYTGGKPSPNPDYPQKISSINGVNLKISNGSKELKIPINLQGNILAKVGDYADELQIYSNGDVNLVKKIREYKMTGNEDITYVHNNNLFDYQQFFDDVPYITGSGLCNYYRYNSVQSGINEAMVHGEFALQNWSEGAWHKYNLMFKNTNYNNASNFKNHLAELYLTGTPVKVYYPRANSITTKIQNIKEELNSFGDYSNIEIETTYS